MNLRRGGMCVLRGGGGAHIALKTSDWIMIFRFKKYFVGIHLEKRENRLISSLK